MITIKKIVIKYLKFIQIFPKRCIALYTSSLVKLLTKKDLKTRLIHNIKQLIELKFIKILIEEKKNQDKNY